MNMLHLKAVAGRAWVSAAVYLVQVAVAHSAGGMASRVGDATNSMSQRKYFKCEWNCDKMSETWLADAPFQMECGPLPSGSTSTLAWHIGWHCSYAWSSATAPLHHSCQAVYRLL